uniref:Uncharacterized protein n=2 Tax=Physcomitrium patens TaxID=3218 RepID=A0A2K1KEN2_PHYPA|nr:hypothetical protein PHYPA_008611 [Physcomitrium patens]
MGTKWCCSGFREPEIKVYADLDAPRLTDVRQFVEESSLSLVAGAEMDPVADTFRGVENFNGAFNWEGLDSSSEKKRPHNDWRYYHKHVENYRKDHAIRARFVLKDPEPERNISGEKGDAQRRNFFSFFWKILPQKTVSQNAIELIEFARDLGNEDCTLEAL